MASTYRRRAFAAFPNECARCAAKERLEVHHIDRNKRNHDIANLQILCHDCHHYEHHLRHREEYDREVTRQLGEWWRNEEVAFATLVKTELVVSIPDVLLKRFGVERISQRISLLIARQLDHEPFVLFQEMLQAEVASGSDQFTKDAA